MAAYSVGGTLTINVVFTPNVDAVGSLSLLSSSDVSANVPVNTLFNIDFGNNGNNIYVIEDASPSIRIRSGTLNTPYDTSAMPFLGGWSSATAPTGYSVAGFAYSGDGAYIHTAFDNAGSGLIYEWSTSTLWGTTLTYSAQLSVSVTHAISFSIDGTKLYTLANNVIHTYSLTTPWRLSGGSLSESTSFSLLTAGSFTDFTVLDDGTGIVLLDDSGNVVSLRLNTPYLISSYVDNGTRATIAQAVGSAGLISDGGNSFYSARLSSSFIDRFAVTPKNFGLGNYARNPNISFTGSSLINSIPSSSFSIYQKNKVFSGSQDINFIPTAGFTFTKAIKNLVFTGSSEITVRPKPFTGWDLERARSEANVDIDDRSQSSINFSGDGRKLVKLSFDIDNAATSLAFSFSVYELSVAFDLNSSRTQVIAKTPILRDSYPTYNDVNNPDNHQLYDQNVIYNEINPAVGISHSIIFMSPDGYNLYIAFEVNNNLYTKVETRIQQYTTLTAFDFSNVTYKSVSIFNVYYTSYLVYGDSAEIAGIETPIEFRDGGKSLYFSGFLQATMSVPYDLSTRIFASPPSSNNGYKISFYSDNLLYEGRIIDWTDDGSKALFNAYDQNNRGIAKLFYGSVSRDANGFITSFTPFHINPVLVRCGDNYYYSYSYFTRSENSSIFSKVISTGSLGNGYQYKIPVLKIPRLNNAKFVRPNNPSVTFKSTISVFSESSTHRVHSISILGNSEVGVISGSSMIGVSYGNASLSTPINFVIKSFDGAKTAVTGFELLINSSGTYKLRGAELGTPISSISSYSGASSSLTGFSKSISISVTSPAYGIASLTSPIKSLVSLGFAGAIGNGSFSGFSVSSSSYGGISASLGKFASTFSIGTSEGSVLSAWIGSFSTKIVSGVITPSFGFAVLRPPMIGLLRGDVSALGFSTKILANNNLVVNNSVTYAVNIKSMETTSYTGYIFDYIVRLAGSYYGVKPDGLYLLEGDYDNGNPIDATIRTNETDFGTSHLKQVPYVYIDTESQTTLSTIVDNSFNSSELSVFNGRRTKLSKGSKGRYWAFEIKNVNGGAMRLGAIEPSVNKLKRRV